MTHCVIHEFTHVKIITYIFCNTKFISLFCTKKLTNNLHCNKKHWFGTPKSQTFLQNILFYWWKHLYIFNLLFVSVLQLINQSTRKHCINLKWFLFMFKKMHSFFCKSFLSVIVLVLSTSVYNFHFLSFYINSIEQKIMNSRK